MSHARIIYIIARTQSWMHYSYNLSQIALQTMVLHEQIVAYLQDEHEKS